MNLIDFRCRKVEREKINGIFTANNISQDEDYYERNGKVAWNKRML